MRIDRNSDLFTIPSLNIALIKYNFAFVIIKSYFPPPIFAEKMRRQKIVSLYEKPEIGCYV